MHRLYEEQILIKNIKSSRYIELEDEMKDLSKSMEIPTGIEEVKECWKIMKMKQQNIGD